MTADFKVLVMCRRWRFVPFVYEIVEVKFHDDATWAQRYETVLKMVEKGWKVAIARPS